MGPKLDLRGYVQTEYGKLFAFVLRGGGEISLPNMPKPASDYTKLPWNM